MPFDIAAAAYDVLSDPAKRLAREGGFLRSLVSPGARVLDMACATGAHAYALAETGAEVVACDLSEAMIAYARTRRPHARLRYEIRDMRQPPRGPFDLALCIGNSLNMLPAPADVDATLRAVRESLAPGGRLLLHCIHPDHPAHREPRTALKRGEVDGAPVAIVKTMQPLPTRRLVTVGWYPDPERPDAPAGLDEPRATASVLLDLRRDDLAARLGAAGYGDLRWYGGLDGSAWRGTGSADMVVLAVRED